MAVNISDSPIPIKGEKLMSKFEQLLDFIVNEDRKAADALFHEIVVETSREIYENIIAEEDEEEDENMEEAFGEEKEDETVESMFDGKDEEEDEFPVQDQTDDFEDDVVDPEFGDAEDEEDMDAPADKSDIKNIEDALEELKAEFEKMMAGSTEEEEDEFGDEEHGVDNLENNFGSEEESEDEGYTFETSEDEDDEETEVKESRIARTQGERMREYIEKVTATMDGGLVGGRTGETMSAPKEGKSPISSGAGKPTSGANAHNIAQGGKGVGEFTGTSPNADKGSRGLVGATKGEFTKSGTKNVSASSMTKKPDGAKLTPVGKPGNKEFAGVGAKTGGDKAGQTGSGDTKSTLTGAPARAK